MTEEALVARIIMHIADGIDMDNPGNERHHQHHGGGQPVDQEPNLQSNPASRQPGINSSVINRGIIVNDIMVDNGRQHDGNAYADDGHPMGAAAAYDFAEQ